MRNKVPLNVSISRELCEKVRKEAERLGMTRSLYLEILLRKVFGLEPKVGEPHVKDG